MTDYVVSSAVTSTSVTLSSGDTMEVVSGGTASRTFVDSGGREIVSAGGSDISALVNPGGEQEVYGSASGDTVAVMCSSSNRKLPISTRAPVACSISEIILSRIFS